MTARAASASHRGIVKPDGTQKSAHSALRTCAHVLFRRGRVMQRWLQILLLGSLIVLYIKAEEIDRSRTADSIPKTISSAWWSHGST